MTPQTPAPPLRRSAVMAQVKRLKGASAPHYTDRARVRILSDAVDHLTEDVDLGRAPSPLHLTALAAHAIAWIDQLERAPR